MPCRTKYMYASSWSCVAYMHIYAWNIVFISLVKDICIVNPSVSYLPVCPFYQHGLTLILQWVSDHMPSKGYDEITYPFQNFNGSTAEVWEYISILSQTWQYNLLHVYLLFMISEAQFGTSLQTSAYQVGILLLWLVNGLDRQVFEHKCIPWIGNCVLYDNIDHASL